MPKPIPFIKPRFPEPEELAGYLRHIYENNYYSNNGPVYFEFKRAIEKYIGQDVTAVVVSNATLGLMIAIQSTTKDMGPKKKYIAVPSFTFAAGPLAIKWCGLEPLFFDTDPDDAQPSLGSFRSLLEVHGDELAGVLLTNNFGIGNAEIDEWEKLTGDRKIPLIIDSAPGFGSTYTDNKPTGGRGTCEVFSMHATKPFGIGEGGLITTRDPKLAEELERLKNFGFNEHKQTVVMGTNAKITEIDCAIGLILLKDYPETLADRRRTYKRFQEKLISPDVAFLPRAETSAIQFVTIMVDPEKRSGILDALKEGGVGFGTYYAPCVHTFPFFAGAPSVGLGGTNLLSEKVVSLPLHPHMEDATVDYICNIIMQQVDGRPRGGIGYEL